MTISPSEVVEIIEKHFPQAIHDLHPDTRPLEVGIKNRASIQGLLGAIDFVPPHLIRLRGDELLCYIASIANLRDALNKFLFELADPKRGATVAYVFAPSLPEFGNQNAIYLIRQCLKKCLDTIPSTSTTELRFIEDPTLRDALRLDLSEARRAFDNGGWKAATVLFACVGEALLLWAIERRRTGLEQLANRPAGNPDTWDLSQFIGVAKKLQLIELPTENVLRQAKNARNLVHPGQVARKKTDCTKGTAATAMAAAELIIEDLSKRF